MSVTLHTTHGDLKLEIFCSSVPKTALNFLALCASGAYNSSPIHRILPSFIIQTGSPASDAKSKSSISIYGPSAPIEDEIRPTLRHNARGIVSMANKGPNTNGSQFFVTLAPQGGLDGRNTVFGRVIAGEDALERIEEVKVDGKGRAVGEVPRIERVTVHANPLAG